MNPLRCLASSTVILAALAAPGHAQEMDNMVFHFTQVEVDAARVDAEALGRWNGSGWIGTDFNRLWWSTEGENADGTFGQAEAMALYGHYFRRFWDVVIGYRQDIEPVTQGYLAFGVAGLAPYWFEVSALGFVSQRGKPSLRFEADTDLFITQRLILTVGGETDWLLADDARLGLDAGISDLELGLRTRYEIRRKFAPYVDWLWVREQSLIEGGAQPVTESGFRVGLGLRLVY